MQESIKTKHYQNFRGIDLSSDPTLCHESRSPFIINMYKDYKASFGKSVETFAGFRKSIEFPREEGVAQKVYDSFFFNKYIENGQKLYPLIHVGKKLFLWSNFPNSLNVCESIKKTVSKGTVTLVEGVDKLVCVKLDGVKINASLATDGKTVTVGGHDGEKVEVFFVQRAMKEADVIFDKMNEQRANYFVKDNLLYIFDGKQILTFDGEKISQLTPYVPTTYVGIRGDATGKQLDFRNMLTDKFKNTLVGDGVTKKFFLSENAIDEVCQVTVYGEIKGVESYTVNLIEGSIEFVNPPQNPIEVGFDEGYFGIEVESRKNYPFQRENVTQMQCGVMFDSRLFLTRNDLCKNTVIYSALEDFTYFPEINYVTVGEDDSRVMDLIVSGCELIAIKTDSLFGAVFALNPFDTGMENNPKAYTVKGIPSSIGSVGASLNFLSEPTFISRLGIKGISNPNLKLEREVENRSSLINSELLYLEKEKIKLFEWRGYLCVYGDGKMYLGDSRVRFSNEVGEREYEWFKIDNVGSFDGQFVRFDFATELPKALEGICKLAPKQMWGEFANAPNEKGEEASKVVQKSVLVEGVNVKYHTVEVEGTLAVGLIDGEIEYETVKEEYLVTQKEDYIGGVFNKATDITSFDDNIYFGNVGNYFSYNFDKKTNGELEEKYYSFDGRVIKNGISTALDNVGFPNLRKNTVGKSLVVKCKTKRGSGVKIKVRTDKKGFSIVGDINNGYFSFDAVNFKNLSFNTSDQQIFMCKENEKNWVEKQIFLYQDEFLKPFSVYYITYQYVVKGKIKNK